MSDSIENDSKASCEQLEARVVAMLLGEASSFEEEQLREQLKTDDALASFCAEIEQTLPLLNEVLDIDQASKVNSLKPRLARNRRNKLKQLFRNGSGLPTRKVVWLDYRKGLAIAAAVCAMLFVAAALLLPRLAESKDGLVVATNSKASEMLGESVEPEDDLRTDAAVDSRKHPRNPGLMGGMGMGGGGGFGGSVIAEGLVEGQSAPIEGVPVNSVLDGADAVSVENFDVNDDGIAKGNIELYGFVRDQEMRDSAETLGTKTALMYSGRLTQESIGSNLMAVDGALKTATGGVVSGEPVNGQILSDFDAEKSEQLGKLVEQDRSGIEMRYFQSELSRAQAGVMEGENAKESAQAEATVLNDVPALGRMFKKQSKSEITTRELSVVPQEQSDDIKALSERDRSLGESARQSLSRSKKDKDLLAELPVVENESLTATTNNVALPASKRDKRQRLVEKNVDESRNRPIMRKPKPFVTANRELLRRKVKEAGNKKLPAKAVKSQITSRSSWFGETKLEGKQLVEKLKEAESQAKASVVYTPRPETVTAENNFSTFSLNVSDVSFKTSLASLQADKLPAPGGVRSEEFLNAFEYRDPMPRSGEPLAFHWERARSPFEHDRDIIRFSVRTAALGRQPGRAVNLVCLLDNSGSMEREDRVTIVKQALGVLARRLMPNDRVSLVTFSRTPKLRIDGMRGGNREAFLKASTGWIPQGGTHIEKGLALAYETAKKHFIIGGNNRVILLTDGAANMGNVDPYQLRKTVESHRKQGIALDSFGIGWEGYNDNLLEVLARNGDGRHGFLNQPAQAVTEFEQKLLGAFQVAASDVKVQVEWNADRVKVFRQVGYLRHQLKRGDFRNNKIDAAEISAAESGNALYVVQVDPDGKGPLGLVRVRYKAPFTNDYTEMEWSLVYESAAIPLVQASPALRLGSVAATFAEWLAENPYAQGVLLGDLQQLISGIPSIYSTDSRPTQLEWMINKARILAGN